MTDPHTPAHRRLLFVCLGNICRSPTAEAVMREMASRQDMKLEFDSAGTGDWSIGKPPDRRMQAAARAAGYELSGLRARQVTETDFGRFDLILAMDRQNLRDLERLRPPGNDTPVRLLLPFGTSGIDEVPDPYLEGGFEKVVRLIEDASDGLLARLQAGRPV